jgi:thiamine biosynthesis protein ThiS
MRIRLNGEEREFNDGLTVEQLLEALRIAGRPVAVELNREVLPKSRYGQTALREGDRLEVVTFVGGG